MSGSQIELVKDFRKLQKIKFFMDGAKAMARFEKENVQDIKMFILCSHGAFKDCLVKFKLDFSGDKYLKEKPARKCLTNIYHPNINSDGSICFSIFDDHWDKNLRLENYVDAFIFLLESPNHSSPLRSSCVEHDPVKFAKNAQNAASGKLSGYDKCKIEMKIEDSQALSKFMANIEIYEANLSIYKDLEMKVNTHTAKARGMHKIKSLRPKLFSRVNECIEQTKKLFVDMKDFIGTMEKEKFEDGIKRVEVFCTHMEEIDEYAKNNSQLGTFGKFEYKFMDRVKKRFVGWKRTFLSDEKVHVNFELKFNEVNEIMKKMVGLKQDEVVQELIDIEKNGFVLDSHVEFCRNVQKFMDHCELIFLVEQKTQVLRGRINSRLGGEEESLKQHFVDHDLKIIRNMSDQLLYEYLGVEKCEEEVVFREGMERIKMVRKNSKVNLEMAHTLFLMLGEISEKKLDKTEFFEQKIGEARQLLVRELHPRVGEPAENVDGIRLKVRKFLDEARKELDKIIEKKKDEEERKGLLSELEESSSDEEENEDDKGWLWSYEGNRVVKKRRVLAERLKSFRQK